MTTIGKNLKRIRTQKRLSLRILSYLSGVSLNNLWEIERGEHIPTVSTLQMVAKGLSIHPVEFFKEDGAKVIHTHKYARIPEITRRDGIDQESLGTGLLLQGIHAWVVTIEPDKGLVGPMGALADTLLFCLDGVVEIYIREQAYILEEQDALLIKGQIPYRYWNMEKQPAQLLIVQSGA